MCSGLSRHPESRFRIGTKDLTSRCNARFLARLRRSQNDIGHSRPITNPPGVSAALPEKSHGASHEPLPNLTTFAGRGYRLDAGGSGSVVEHHLAKVRVAGSNPVFRSNHIMAYASSQCVE